MIPSPLAVYAPRASHDAQEPGHPGILQGGVGKVTAGELGADEEVSLAPPCGYYSCCFPESGISRPPLRPAEVQPKCSHFPSGYAGETRASVGGEGARQDGPGSSRRVPAVHVPGAHARAAAPTAGALAGVRGARTRPRGVCEGVAHVTSSTWSRKPRCGLPCPSPGSQHPLPSPHHT